MVAVTAAHAAVHADQARALGETRLAGQGSGDIRHGADGDDGDLFRRVHDGVDERLHAVLVDLAGISAEVVLFDPLGLRAVAARLGIHADPDRHTRVVGGLEQLGQKLGAVQRLAVFAHGQLQIKLGAPQQERQRPSVIDVVTNIGREDDGFGLVDRAGSLGACRSKESDRQRRDERRGEGEEPAVAVACSTSGEVHKICAILALSLWLSFVFRILARPGGE